MLSSALLSYVSASADPSSATNRVSAELLRPPKLIPERRISMPPLKKAPSSIDTLAAITFPVKEPSERILTELLAVQLPRTLPSTTISRAMILASTSPLGPTVTRLPDTCIEPSTLPSINNVSDPVNSPLIVRDLPIVATCGSPSEASSEAIGKGESERSSRGIVF